MEKYKIIYPDFDRVEKNLEKYNKKLKMINNKYRFMILCSKITGYYHESDNERIIDSGYHSNIYFGAVDRLTIFLIISIISYSNFKPIFYVGFVLTCLSFISIPVLIFMGIYEKIKRIKYDKELQKLLEEIPFTYCIEFDDSGKACLIHDYFNRYLNEMKVWKSSGVTEVYAEYVKNKCYEDLKIKLSDDEYKRINTEDNKKKCNVSYIFQQGFICSRIFSNLRNKTDEKESFEKSKLSDVIHDGYVDLLQLEEE